MKVIAITDKEAEEDYRLALKKKSLKIYIFYMMISRTGYRQGDIIGLRVRNVRAEKAIKSNLGLIEQKTKTYREVPIPTELRRELKKYVEGKADWEPLFPATWESRKKKGKMYMDYTTAYKVMKEVGESVGLYNIGTHTGRKTYGHRIFKATGNIGDAQIMLGHRDVEHTKVYIGADESYKQTLTKKAFG